MIWKKKILEHSIVKGVNVITVMRVSLLIVIYVIARNLQKKIMQICTMKQMKKKNVILIKLKFYYHTDWCRLRHQKCYRDLMIFLESLKIPDEK